MRSPMSFKTFARQFRRRETDICRELFHEYNTLIRVKKESVAVENLEKIIEATLRLANEKGFQSMSLRDLSAATGMSSGGLYAYIRNKDDLVHLIQRHGVMITLRSLHEEIAAGSTPREQLNIAIRTHLYVTEILQAWFYFSYMEAKNLPGEEKKNAMRAEVAVEDVFTDIIRNGQTLGEFMVTDAQMLAATIKALLQDWYLKRWKYRQRSVTVEQYADHLQSLVELALIPGASEPEPGVATDHR